MSYRKSSSYKQISHLLSLDYVKSDNLLNLSHKITVEQTPKYQESNYTVILATMRYYLEDIPSTMSGYFRPLFMMHTLLELRSQAKSQTFSWSPVDSNLHLKL
ncbi:unnamed protein product [Moneuplotes crassus]|uniref:Uncharacterized protein n=1 Tax=Euplotes crassus TaxID=5936 RepID=A0AAD1XL15_EUPCR|nr:unnamed protein product [Moneuplotes crassus]